ncbi:MAG TPA: tetratricopeptide repeat protein [Halomicronema sp.]
MTSVGKEKEYEITRRKQIERKQKLFAAVSLVGFGGSMVFGMAQLFTNVEQTQNAGSNVKPATEESPLTAEARGYELVLQREPNNQAALEGLVNVLLKMNQPQKALLYLEKLIELNPSRQDYKTLREQLNTQMPPSKSETK